jgi:dTDP-4-amino-4,6-dideoxygalactose transaminase
LAKGGYPVIPLFNLSTHYKRIRKEIDRTTRQVLESGQYILGKEVESFEKEFAKYLRVKYAVGVASGTDALKIAIEALGLKAGDEVIVPANVYPTAFGVVESGVLIRLIDIDPQTYNIDVSKIEKGISKKTKAIVLVHLFGQVADMGPVLKIAKQHKLLIIEDCAQAHGAQWNGEKVGAIGDVGCFSFYPTKPLGAYGDGGMVVTNNFEIYKKILFLRMYGESRRYQSQILGHNSRLDELQAAILRVKLKYLDRWNCARKLEAKRYIRCLSKIKEIKLPEKKIDHVYHLFVIQAAFRDELKTYLEKQGIISGVHYPLPIHLVKSFSFLGYKKGDFPVAEKFCQQALSLPIYPDMTTKDVSKIFKGIKNFYAKKKA